MTDIGLATNRKADMLSQTHKTMCEDNGLDANAITDVLQLVRQTGQSAHDIREGSASRVVRTVANHHGMPAAILQRQVETFADLRDAS
jgi:hypothetical protein